jgi:hypothetical protein
MLSCPYVEYASFYATSSRSAFEITTLNIRNVRPQCKRTIGLAQARTPPGVYLGRLSEPADVPAIDILIILGLILLNGVFAMAELALVSAKRVRLEKRADDPSAMLSTVQVGITLISIFNGAFGEASLVSGLQPHLAAVAPRAPYACQCQCAGLDDFQVLAKCELSVRPLSTTHCGRASITRLQLVAASYRAVS